MPIRVSMVPRPVDPIFRPALTHGYPKSSALCTRQIGRCDRSNQSFRAQDSTAEGSYNKCC